MVTALAGLRHIDRITRYFPIDDTGRFDRWEAEGFVANCWIFTQSRVGHGPVDIVQALECSCNYYFLSVSDSFPQGQLAAADIIAETAQEFGLGRTTGLEIPENAGRLATPDVKRELYERGQVDRPGWNVADTLLAGFGQGHNRFTPVQLANYAATIGNGGTLYSLSILQRVRSSDHTETLFEQTPKILNQIEEIEYLEIIQEGMIAASRGRAGTARSVFRNYPITVASKTGTVQIEGARVNDGVFVCYAPAENPEIAISIVVEKGGSGREIMDIARMIFDHYFVTDSTFLAAPYGTLIP
jgi:penicillin-binding protein 2